MNYTASAFYEPPINELKKLEINELNEVDRELLQEQLKVC